jgi:thiol-disulfide isomerase/thioredoxin
MSHDSSDGSKEISDRKKLTTMIRQGSSWSGHERNCCFLNLGPDKGFSTVSALSGLDKPDDSRAISVVDWDHDGDLDLWVRNRTAPRLRFFNNEAGSSTGDYISIKLVGNGTTTNRDAIGARLEIIPSAGDKKIIKTVRMGENFLSQNSSWIHFGLGEMKEKNIQSLLIRWPDTTHSTQVFNHLPINQRYLIEQGKEPIMATKRDAESLVIEPGEIEIAEPADSVRIPAISLISAPRIHGRDFHGNELTTNSHGQWTLVNLWASWCQPCVTELKTFVSAQEKIKAAGIRIIALSVDGVGENKGNATAALKLLKKLKFPFEAGLVHESFLDNLVETTDYLTGRSDPPSLPMSVLMDPKNRISVIYRGIVEVDQLIEDASKIDRSLEERWMRAVPLGGKAIDHPYFIDQRRKIEATAMFRLGKRYEDQGNLPVAKYYMERALEYWPDFEEVKGWLSK